MSNPIGRPSDYDPKYIQVVEDYIKAIPDRPKQLPKIVDIAILVGVPEKTIYAWAKDNEDFRKSLDVIKDEQQKMLIDRGLFDKDVNAVITKLLLMSNHNMREKNDTDLTSNGEQVVGFTYVAPDKTDSTAGA